VQCGEYLDITKAGSSSNVIPGIPNAKNNQFFCIKKGTTTVWMTSNKNTGFMVSFGTDSPFDPTIRSSAAPTSRSL
jgi:hypothetical protein